MRSSMRGGWTGGRRPGDRHLLPARALLTSCESILCTDYPGDEPPLKTQETGRPSDRRAATHCATRRAETQKYLPKSTRDLP